MIILAVRGNDRLRGDEGVAKFCNGVEKMCHGERAYDNLRAPGLGFSGHDSKTYMLSTEGSALCMEELQ